MPSKAKSAPVKSVEALMQKLPAPQRELLNEVRAHIHGAIPAATEGVKWNSPSFALANDFATCNIRGEDGVLLVLHLGAKARPGVDLRKDAALDHPLLEWKGPDRALVRIPDLEMLHATRETLTRLLKAWSRHV